MNETQTIAGLENEIRGMEQAYENAEISKSQLKAGIADLKRQIKAQKLKLAKQKKKSELDDLRKSGKIPGLAYVHAKIAIQNAKTLADLNRI